MSDLAEHLHEAFEDFGRITLRRMFGGHGVFHEGLMFGLVLGDQLYLKADTQTVAAFEAKHLAPFEYLRQGKPTRLSYYQAPPEVFDERDEAAAWARLAWEAALRANAAKSAVRPRSKTTSKPKAKTVSKTVAHKKA